MMKNWLVVWLFATMLVVAGCASDTTTEETEGTTLEDTEEIASEDEGAAEEADVSEEITISLTKNSGEEEITSKDIVFAEGDTVMDALKANFDVVEEGGFITSIEGIESNEEEQMAWLYSINGEPAMKGANEIELSAGDEIVFDYSKW
ncbi:DUF4430 domain-containing protein [Bacillus fonticola]|uniref:DUF4430 domain-containing protein n=1 Tax=Bacillus fonticola TaxID=2728853 RepID=UPI001475EFD8|nr:DUF4430 domain-containing protein [Bacillus fonticola]